MFQHMASLDNHFYKSPTSLWIMYIHNIIFSSLDIQGACHTQDNSTINSDITVDDDSCNDDTDESIGSDVDSIYDECQLDLSENDEEENDDEIEDSDGEIWSDEVSRDMIYSYIIPKH